MILLTSLFTISCGLTTGKHTEENLTFRISSDKKGYQEGESAQIALEFVNNTKNSLKLLSDIFSLRQAGLTLYLRKSDGSVTPVWQFTVKEKGQSLPALWQTLNQGEIHKTTMNLTESSSDSFTVAIPHGLVLPKLLPPDTYEIYSVFDFDKEKAKAMGITIDKTDESLIWFGKVTSNTIKITIKPK